MRNYLSYRVSAEDHPKHNDMKVHTFKFDTEEERDAFEAGINFVEDCDVFTSAVGLRPDEGIQLVPGLVVTVRSPK